MAGYVMLELQQKVNIVHDGFTGPSERAFCQLDQLYYRNCIP